jgi:branched-subunit amino acid aminotransferase/4-amino-4-deoxychorismate lyase
MIESLNRAFMYGESVFTTLRMLNGYPQDWELHYERLRAGVDFVYGPFTEGEDWAPLFRNRLESLWNLESGDKVVRITVYREQARGQLRSSLISCMDLKLHINAAPFDPARAIYRPLNLRTCSAIQRPHWWPGYLKAGNYLPTILSQKMFLQPGDDDLLFLSPADTVLSSSVANIFVVKNNKLFTPPIGPNVLDGVMRSKVISAAYDFFDECYERTTELDQLFRADAVFGTNSVRGPFLIGKIDDHEINYDQGFINKFDVLRSKVWG